jgi:hypothetical protein
MARRLQQIRMIRGNAPERVAWANLCDGAFVAVYAPIMTHLQEQRAVAKPIATFHAFCASNAEALVDRVFVIRILHERPLDRSSGAQLVFCSSVQIVRRGLEIPSAKLAIPAQRITVNAFHRGLLQHAMRRATLAPQTLGRIDLPNRPRAGSAVRDNPRQTSEASHRSYSSSIPQKLAAALA